MLLDVLQSWFIPIEKMTGIDPGMMHPDTQANFTRLASFIALTKSDTIQQVLFSNPAVPFKELLPAYSQRVLSV
jgi:hypothetical protein